MKEAHCNTTNPIALHQNPAVTLALWLIGALKTVRAILLTVAQFVGVSFR